MSHKRYLIFAILLAFVSVSFSQVSNARFEVSGETIRIYYDLSSEADVSVFLSTDGGRSYDAEPLRQVRGDVGTVGAGTSHCIVWDVLKERENLIGDNISFRVHAAPISGNMEFKVGTVSFSMVYVKGGNFFMGCNGGGYAGKNASPEHMVAVNGYFIGETEVTQALWIAVMGTMPVDHGGWTLKLGRGDDYPVYRVSYNDVMLFISRLNQKTGRTFRLPTEAEWEYAARGGAAGSTNVYSGAMSVLRDVAWYYENSASRTHPVKGKRANELGLYDMSGNVSEWCSDRYSRYSAESQINPTGAKRGPSRVVRGGNWNSKEKECRVFSRDRCEASLSSGLLGFRLVLSAQ